MSNAPKDPLDEFERCMEAVYLELPETIADDVNRIVRTHITIQETKARIDELENFQWNDPHMHVHTRIAKLNSNLSKGDDREGKNE